MNPNGMRINWGNDRQRVWNGIVAFAFVSWRGGVLALKHESSNGYWSVCGAKSENGISTALLGKLWRRNARFASYWHRPDAVVVLGGFVFEEGEERFDV